MRAALKQLCRHGIEALRAQKVNDKWRSPRVSRRVAGDLRKAAVRNGTYGKFDPITGVGWDPAWDAPQRRKRDPLAVGEGLDRSELLGSMGNQAGIASIRPPKETKRERTRESRAQKIENLLEQADDKIAEFRKEMEDKKPKPGIEEEYKRMMKGSKW
ncbi:hypothetical protein ACHAWF_000274 [Thalassiosira exigua]